MVPKEDGTDGPFSASYPIRDGTRTRPAALNVELIEENGRGERI